MTHRRSVPSKSGPVGAIVFAFAALTGAACSGGSAAGTINGVGNNAVPASNIRNAVLGLCTGARQAADPAAAKAAFFDLSHAGLHDLAYAQEQHDRAGAAKLLVAMQTVEADLNAPPGSRPRADDLAALARQAALSQAAVGLASTTCPS